MTREQAIQEVNKVFEPAFANYIITALTEGATVSDRCEDGKNKFVPLTYGSDTKTYVRADTIVQITEGKDETYVYTANSDAPFRVKECVNEILAKMGVTHGSN